MCVDNLKDSQNVEKNNKNIILSHLLFREIGWSNRAFIFSLSIYLTIFWENWFNVFKFNEPFRPEIMLNNLNNYGSGVQ